VEKKSCPGCGGMYAPLTDGGLRAHGPVGSRCPQVSDPAPTVDETTTEGDDMNPDAEAHLDAADMRDADPGYIDYERRVTYGEDKGPWFGAMYEGQCSVSECRIYEGDRIRADGRGGYECEDCGDDDLSNIAPETPTYQEQARAAARRHAQHEAGIIAATQERVDVALAADMANAYGSMGGADLFEDPTPHTPPKPVMSVSGQPKEVLRDHLGRYAVVLPGETELEVYKSSGKPVGRTRATTFNKSATDKKNINDWNKRNVLIGASRRRDLVLQATGLTHERDKDKLNALVVQLEETAGAKVGSDLGTYLHEFTEYIDAGLKTYKDAPEEFQESLRRYTQQLKYAGLEPIRSLIERTTIIREYGWVCGTFDRIFYHRPSGQYVIGDLKTGKTMDYGKNETETQLWIYAHGVNQNGVYDWNTRTWATVVFDPDRADVVQVSESVGVVIHMPVQGPQEGTVSLLWADLKSGADHARVCGDVRARPQGRMKAWGDGPAPLAPHAVTSWELRFASVTSGEEASALWREAKAAGIVGVRLNELITLARIALRELGVKG